MFGRFREGLERLGIVVFVDRGANVFAAPPDGGRTILFPGLGDGTDPGHGGRDRQPLRREGVHPDGLFLRPPHPGQPPPSSNHGPAEGRLGAGDFADGGSTRDTPNLPMVGEAFKKE